MFVIPEFRFLPASSPPSKTSLSERDGEEYKSTCDDLCERIGNLVQKYTRGRFGPDWTRLEATLGNDTAFLRKVNEHCREFQSEYHEACNKFYSMSRRCRYYDDPPAAVHFGNMEWIKSIVIVVDGIIDKHECVRQLESQLQADVNKQIKDIYAANNYKTLSYEELKEKLADALYPAHAVALKAMSAEVANCKAQLALMQEWQDEAIRFKQYYKNSQTRLADAWSQIARLSVDPDRLQAQIRTMTAELAQLASATAENVTLRNSLADAQSAIAGLNVEPDRLQAQISTMTAELAHLASATAENVTLRNSLADAQSAIAGLNVEPDRLRAEIRTLTRRSQTALEAQVSASTPMNMPFAEVLSMHLEFADEITRRAPSRPARAVAIPDEDRQEAYIGKCAKIRQTMELVVGSGSIVKRRLIELDGQISRSDIDWAVDLHDYVCNIIHYKWDSTGDWTWVAAAKERINHVFRNIARP